jgi:hypothetical protein
MRMGEEGTLLKRRRHTPEQVIRKLREAERLLGERRPSPPGALLTRAREYGYRRWCLRGLNQPQGRSP